MLGTTQKWIKTNAAVYAQMAKKDAEIRQILDDNTKKMNILKQKADDLKSKAEAARIAHDKKVANLESQISILKPGWKRKSNLPRKNRRGQSRKQERTQKSVCHRQRH